MEAHLAFCNENTKVLSYDKLKTELEKGLELHQECAEDACNNYTSVYYGLLKIRNTPLDVIFKCEGMSLDIIKLLHSFNAVIVIHNLINTIKSDVTTDEKIRILDYVNKNIKPLANIVDSSGCTLLETVYSETGYFPTNVDIKLLEWLILCFGININRGVNNTPLHSAIRNKLPYKHIKFLINHGADINRTNMAGLNVLGTLSYRFINENCKKLIRLIISESNQNVDICKVGIGYYKQTLFYRSFIELLRLLQNDPEKTNTYTSHYMKNIKYLKKFMTTNNKKTVLDEMSTYDALYPIYITYVLKYHETLESIIVANKDPGIVVV